MTEREIEEKACEFARNYPELSNYNSAISGFKNGFREGYQQGIKGNGVVWHDLRKNPNNLPNDNEKVLTKETTVYYIASVENGIWYGDDVGRINPVAWCEIPKFDEVE